jgi:CheY-like chemotaxis protein
MHGEIGFESNPGHGSTFWFQLPHALAGEAAASESAKTAVPPPLPPGLRVLVADDNPVNRMLAERQLAKLGCSAVAVDSGPEAIAALTGHTFDIVLMDCLMPGMSGFETARAIRAREAAHDRPRIPVVALTASVLEEDRKAVAASGMDGYLAKPVTLDRLRSMLAQHARPPQRQAAGPTAGPATVESQS